MVASSDYPYTAVQSDCQSDLPPLIAPNLATSAVEYDLNGNEAILKAVLCQNGPVVVVMMASPVFLTYKSGIFYDSAANCPSGCNKVNHALLLVGKRYRFPSLQKSCSFPIFQGMESIFFRA